MQLEPINPSSIRLESSTVCQLKCPGCPTTSGEIAASLGSGFLSLEKFRMFLDENPRLERIELSNWGEPFLNKAFESILELAHTRGVALTLANGANLNRVRPSLLEAMVKYRLRILNCSLDGADQPSYEKYRVNGDFSTVIANIRAINAWKQHYRSSYPKLNWQFIAFSHNEHEIDDARRMAESLDMHFTLKLAWEDLYGQAIAPVRNLALVREQSGIGVASRSEFRDKYGFEYAGREMCLQLWKSPQVNWDGRLLGCAVNHWGDYGNVFEEGLLKTLNNEKMAYARQMLMGRVAAKEGIPCTRCRNYTSMKGSGQWITRTEVAPGAAAQPGSVPNHDPPPPSEIASQGYRLDPCSGLDSGMAWLPRILYRGASAGCDFVQCHHSLLARGRIPHAPHAHVEEELLIMLAGEADLILPDRGTESNPLRRRVRAGDLVYYPTFFRHTLQAVGSEPASYLMFKWSGQGAMPGNPLAHQFHRALESMRSFSSAEAFSVSPLFEGSTRYLSKLHCHLSVLRPGGGYAEHIDDYDVALIVLEGEVETLGERFAANSLIFYARGEPHGIHNPGDREARYITFEFHGRA